MILNRLQKLSRRAAPCCAFAVLAFAGAPADAAVRYAAPGADGPSPCLKAAPCSLYVAASNDVSVAERAQKGDEVVVLPGEYSGVGDLGPEEKISLPTQVDIRGNTEGPRPVVWIGTRNGGVTLNGWSLISDLEIIGPEVWSPLNVGLESTAERVVVRSSAKEGIACWLGFRSVLRDSVCISSGEKGAGAGQKVGTNSAVSNTRTLRNVTAIGAGPESVGLLFDISGGEVFIDVKSTIARGTATDVEAIGREAGGGSAITLQASDFETANAFSKTGGSASVTPPGTNGNITAAPALALDGYHQLAGSPTIDEGVVDGESGELDVDAQARAIGAGPDIGADEFAHTTATSVSCQPSVISSVPQPGTALCTATVADASSAPLPPAGKVGFQTTSGTISDSCSLSPVNGTSSSCQASYSPIPGDIGVHPILATYFGGGSHDGSVGATAISVLQDTREIPTLIGDPGGSGRSGPPSSLLGKHPPKRTRKNVARFTFFSEPPGAAFQCKLDNRPYRACRAPFKATVTNGRHLFRVRAFAAGTSDPTPATFRWSVLP